MPQPRQPEPPIDQQPSGAAVGISELLCAGWRFTQHSIERFRSRARGVKRKYTNDTLVLKMSERLKAKKYLYRDRYYTAGLVWVIRGNVVITVMKPTEARLQEKVWKAHNAELSDPSPRGFGSASG